MLSAPTAQQSPCQVSMQSRDYLEFVRSGVVGIFACWSSMVSPPPPQAVTSKRTERTREMREKILVAMMRVLAEWLGASGDLKNRPRFYLCTMPERKCNLQLRTAIKDAAWQ